MADSVTITEFDDAGNVVSVTETEVFTFDSPDALKAFLDSEIDAIADDFDGDDSLNSFADGEALASAGMGTDEDYGYFGEDTY